MTDTTERARALLALNQFRDAALRQREVPYRIPEAIIAYRKMFDEILDIHIPALSQQADRGVDDAIRVIACELARIDGYDPEDQHGGLYDLRWSGGPQPEPAGDAWSMDYLPKAERIGAALLAARGCSDG